MDTRCIGFCCSGTKTVRKKCSEGFHAGTGVTRYSVHIAVVEAIFYILPVRSNILGNILLTDKIFLKYVMHVTLYTSTLQERRQLSVVRLRNSSTGSGRFILATQEAST